MDILTIIGILIAFGGVVGGMIFEGGHVGSIIQLAAAIIVFGGTIGAVLTQTPISTFILAVKNSKLLFVNPDSNPKRVIKQLSDFAAVARKEGLLALESKAKNIRDPFFKKGLHLIVDGTEPAAARDIMEIELSFYDEYNMASAKVYELAGGYAPTVGIIGAVLGLIHVMENLAEPEKLGAGIAVAFVATVYGVGSANLLFLPFAGKIKSKVREEVILRELMIEGLVSLSEGENPRRLEEKLSGFLRDSGKK